MILYIHILWSGSEVTEECRHDNIMRWLIHSQQGGFFSIYFYLKSSHFWRIRHYINWHDCIIFMDISGAPSAVFGNWFNMWDDTFYDARSSGAGIERTLYSRVCYGIMRARSEINVHFHTNESTWYMNFGIRSTFR